MRKIVWISLILLVPTAAYGQSVPHRKDIPAIAKAANGAVVSIIMADADGNVTAKGTGFFISRDGRILTNYHVIENAEGEHSTPTIKLHAGAILNVDKLLAYDKKRDIAIIKVSGEFRTVALGDSDKVQVGEEIVAIGNPLSLESTVSNGIVSAVRTNEKEGGRFLQITAPISAGSSGGPLFNMSGEVIGITAAKLEGGENLNFAIPINDTIALIYESEGPESAAHVSGDYACDVDVISTMHLTLSVSGEDLVLTIYSQSGAGETHFHRDGNRWTQRRKGDYPHNLEKPGPIFLISNAPMRFHLYNTFYYDEARGQILAGAKGAEDYLPPLTLSGTCKRILAK